MKGLLLASLPAWAKAAEPPSTATVRAARLHQGETALMQGDAEAAMQAFEQAGALGHDPAIELGLVSAAMQAGHYRQALGFAAHTAGEHAQDAACLATYLWLLRLGGQADFARQLWATASQRTWPEADQRVLQAVRDAWAGPWPRAEGLLRQSPLHLAPHPHGQTVPNGARVLASGTLVRDAQGVQRAIVPASVVTAGARQDCWVRNGLGFTVKARLDQVAGLVATLRLEEAMPDEATAAPRDAFPGSPAHAFAQAVAPAPDGAAAWPLMKMGFAGQVHRQGGRLLGIEVQAGSNPLGGPVLDAQGRLTGVAIGLGADPEPERLVPTSTLARLGWLGPPAQNPQGAPLPSDELYEHGLKSTLQLIEGT